AGARVGGARPGVGPRLTSSGGGVGAADGATPPGAGGATAAGATTDGGAAGACAACGACAGWGEWAAAAPAASGPVTRGIPAGARRDPVVAARISGGRGSPAGGLGRALPGELPEVPGWAGDPDRGAARCGAA